MDMSTAPQILTTHDRLEHYYTFDKFDTFDIFDYIVLAVATNACSVTRSLKLSNVEPG